MLRNFYYSFKEGIKNLIRWLPVIWNDRDWDEHFIFVLLHKKLEHMEQLFRSDNVYTAKADRVADEIRLVKLITKRIIDSEYLSNAMFWYDKIYCDKKLYTTVKDEKRDALKLVWTDDNKQRKMFRKCGDHADKMEQQDIEFLFAYLQKHMKNWWD